MREPLWSPPRSARVPLEAFPSDDAHVVTQLVEGKSLSDLLSALGQGLAQNAQAAGYKVVTK